MSEYLWDKTGADPDVERLEFSLSGLAYDGDPPSLPVRWGPARAPTLVLSPALPPMRAPAFRSGAPWTHARATPLALAIGLTLMGLGVSYSALTQAKADVRQGWNLVPVVVAAVDLSEGTVLSLEHLSQRSVPEQFVTSSVITPGSGVSVVGRKVQVTLAAGDPIQWSQLETSRSGERLATRIIKRARALAVEVRGTAGVGGWLRPNDHVDIIGSLKDPLSGEQVAVTLMQNVMVLATGKLAGSTNFNLLPEAQRAYADLSLMVLPEEAELLVLAQGLGRLTFSLRHEDDLDVLEERGRATLASLLSGERTRALQAKRLNTIQIIRGVTAQPPPQSATSKER